LQIAIICIAARATFDGSEGQFDALKPSDMRLLTLQMPEMAVSATQIRQLIAGGLGENTAIATLLPSAVASYIAHHQLYKAD
jgi:nicotinic acid mononucleotide adenylyltransferase